MRFLLTALGLAAVGMASAATSLETASAQGLPAFLWACFLGGLVALLTPCVFPMVPVTVSYFSKRAEVGTHKAAFAYCFGIMGAFVGVGALVSIFKGSIDAAGVNNFAAHPVVNLVLALIFILMAFNLFGFYEIQLPSGLTNRMMTTAQGNNQSLVGPILMGTTFALTTFTCTAPIVGSLLAMSAQGDWKKPIAGMAFFGLAFALPFLGLAMFPTMMGKMPKSGSWLGAVKPALGFVELMAAVKFLSNAELQWQMGILTRPVFIAVWAILAAMLAAYLFGFPTPLPNIGWARKGFAVLSGVTAVWLLSGLNGKNLGEITAYLPPEPYPYKESPIVPGGNQPGSSGQVALDANGHVVFETDYEKALARAKEEGKPVFIDFTGIVCVNCRLMEENMFPKPEVQERFKDMIPVKLYTDKGDAESKKNQELLKKMANTVAIPVYVVVTPDGKVIDKYEGLSRNVDEYTAFLDKGINAVTGGKSGNDSGGVALDEKGRVKFGTDYEAAVAKAQKEGKAVFVDFTGWVCINCRQMEEGMFPKPEVQERFKSMVPVKLYTDKGDAENKRNQELLKKLANTVAIPVYVLIGPDGKVIDKFEGMTRSVDEYTAFLDKGVNLAK